MRKVGEGNEIISCNEVDTFSFEPWIEKDVALPIVALQQQTRPHIVTLKPSNDTNEKRVPLTA